MLRNTFTKFAPKATQNTFLKPNTITKSLFLTPKAFFRPGPIDNYLNRLNHPLTYYLIGANVGVFFLWHSGLVSTNWMQKHFTLSLSTIQKGYYHTLLTYGFSHVDAMHLFFNMFSLYFFGTFTENMFGRRHLFYLYIIGTIASGLFIHSSNMSHRNPFPTLGASGATNAILTFFIFNFPNQKILLFFFPVPAWAVGVLLLGQSLYMYDGRNGVSGAGHLGGFCTGLFYYLLKR